MNKYEEQFHQIANDLLNASEGKLFGALSIKANNGKTAAFLWENKMVFKLDEKSQKQALELDGACTGTHIYSPEKQMKGWISIPEQHMEVWAKFAGKAVIFVS